MKARMTPEQAERALLAMVDKDFVDAPADMQLSDSEYERLVQAGRRTVGRPTLDGADAASPQITIRLPRELDRKLRERASLTGVTVSQWARNALVRELMDA